MYRRCTTHVMELLGQPGDRSSQSLIEAKIANKIQQTLVDTVTATAFLRVYIQKFKSAFATCLNVGYADVSQHKGTNMAITTCKGTLLEAE